MYLFNVTTVCPKNLITNALVMFLCHLCINLIYSSALKGFINQRGNMTFYAHVDDTVFDQGLVVRISRLFMKKPIADVL